MGVYIIGMEMPKDRPQLLWVYPNGKALTVQSDVDPWKELQAVPVQPHGKLGDLDALMGRIEYDAPLSSTFEKVMRWYIENAPTVIEAEEGET